MSVRLRVDGRPHVNGYAGNAAARTLSRIAVLSRDQRTRAKYDYTHYPHNDGREKMRFLRHPPCPPIPLLPSTAESRPTKTPTMGGMISQPVSFCKCAHPRHADSGHPRCTRATHVPGHGQQKRPVATTGVDITVCFRELCDFFLSLRNISQSRSLFDFFALL